MIKIATGFSHKGGSTFAFINLTNELNKRGYDCTLYGPHNWHLDKCKSGLLKDMVLDKNDVLIIHFLKPELRPDVRKVILSTHEKNLYEVGSIKQFWDLAVFLNQKHADYHWTYNGDYVLIPNLKETLIKKDKKHLDKVAGIIGSFDLNKQVDVSIKRALTDGCEKVYLFGDPNSGNYFQEKVKPLLSEKVQLIGFLENKQEMYDMIGRVYHSSISEVATLVKDECESTGTKFFGNEATTYEPIVMTNDQIIDKWINILEI